MKRNKKEILEYLKNHTWRETSTFFGVSEMTLSRWLKQIPQNLDYSFAIKKLLSWKNQTVRKYATIIKNEKGLY